MNKWFAIQDRGFFIFIIVSYICYAGIILGVSFIDPKYLSMIDFFAKIYICAFLFWRFNPFVKHIQCTELDRKIIFSSAFFIFTSTALNQILLSYLDDARSAFMHILPK